MSVYDDEARVDPYELVEQFWPYDGPYSDDLTTSAATTIGRLGRYLNNATQKADGLRYVAVVGRVLAELHGAVASYEQLLAQLARYLVREADTDPSVYDDRHDRPGALTADQVAADLHDAITAARALSAALAVPAQRAYHLGSD